VSRNYGTTCRRSGASVYRRIAYHYDIGNELRVMLHETKSEAFRPRWLRDAQLALA
jgi:hypothetical protein